MSRPRITTETDPLGPLTRVALDLPHPEPHHQAPTDELAALTEAGASAAVCDFIDHPNDDPTAWPSADREFLTAIREWTTHRDNPPAVSRVWARIHTAQRRLTTRHLQDHRAKAPGRPEPSREALPADYHGPSPDTLRNALDRYDDGRIVHHLPPGDGLHRVAWMQFPHRDHWTVDLYCECSIAGIIRPSGGTAAFRRNGCPYVALAAYLRALQLQPTVGPAEPATLRRLLDRAHAGEWLGQQHGGDMWGSNLYLQTVSTLLDLPMPWALADRAVAQRLIGLDGSVLCEPLPERVRPAGPITDWETGAPREPGWVIWSTHIDERYLAEVVTDPDNRDRGTLAIYDHTADARLLRAEEVRVSHGAVFGPDAGDIHEWSTALRRWLRDAPRP